MLSRPPQSRPAAGKVQGIESLRMSRGPIAPGAPNHRLYRPALGPFLCYPEGNFGGNQLLNDSIGLSPLCSNLTNDLHVSTATAFHQDFSWLRPIQA